MTESDINKLAQTAVHLLSHYYQSREQIAWFRRQMVNAFNEDELRNLCFDLHINYDTLSGSGTSDKAREIILLCLRQGRESELFAYCQEARPDAFTMQQFPEKDTVVAETATAELLHARLTENMQTDPYAAQTLARMAEQPDSETRQTALASLLTESMSNNVELAHAVRQALGETAVGDQIKQEVTLSDNAQAGDINMIGKVEGNVPEETLNKQKKKKWWWQR